METDELRRVCAELAGEAAALRRAVDSLWPAGVRRCRHTHATMVQHNAPGVGWIVTWQCDDCGMSVADRPVTADDLERGATLPWFDRDAALRGIERLEQQPVVTAAFFGKAARR